MAAPAEAAEGGHGQGPPCGYPVEGPEPGPIEEPAVVAADPHAAIDEALDIDVEDVQAPTGERARIVEHQLTQLPANRYCEACVCGRMQQARSFTGAFSRRGGHILGGNSGYSCRGPSPR